ncbi:MAG: type II secretion system minor pseudopilin GspI [Succinivibrionaceae bacterium]|nr:type II secretion system minor pseudopilin GspI [Succinivibrionaceae bacterium]
MTRIRNISDSRGMTILEVLVALAVFAMVGVALLSAMNNQSFGLQRLEEKTYATIVADNVLTELEMRQLVPSFSWNDGSETMVDREWFYRYKAEETQDDSFVAVTIQVHATKEYDDPIVTLMTHMYRRR